MHTLTKKRMNNFAREFGFEADPESVIFEKYIAATYLYRYIQNDVQLIENCVLGGGNDEGIDIAAVTVNGQLVFEPADVDELIEKRSSNTAKLILIQAKTSGSFESAPMAKFLHGVELTTKKMVADEDVKLPRHLVDIAALIDRIAENLAYLSSSRIPCELYYVTTSSNDGSPARNELQVTEAMSRIVNLEVFEDEIRLQTHGHEQIAAKEKERHGPQNVRFDFEKRQTIPPVEGVEEAYIGLLPVVEVLKILTDGDDVRPGIFDDNVRLDLGANNPVNSRIYDTLDSSQRTQFPFLNNGLTVIASKLQGAGDKFLISGYQIVNGGQTSHQLLRWSKSEQVQANPSLLNEVFVPIKIVSSEDKDVRSRVAVATNLQTAIGNEEIQSSFQIAKDVEEFFSESGHDGLRYERQNRGEPLDFVRTRVVNTSDLNRAVVSVVFGQSSKAISSPKFLATEDSEVWGDYPVEMYFYAAWIVYRIDRYFARTPEKVSVKAAKYHIAMLVSAIVNPRIIEAYEREPRAAKLLKKSGMFALDSSELKDKIEGAIPTAIDFVIEQFSSILDQGRSLRRDDIRAQSHQIQLLDRAVSSFVDGETL
ncbi:AIPR family protein [Corynebacterium casei]|uniref:AIPR family protein n=1 Tax=Corynebacterium casei TaxID=160386 RepID=UPI003FD1D0C6